MLLDERLRLAAAARLDHHDLYGAQLSPKAAVSYEVAPEQKIRFGYNRAFKSPTILENFLRINDVLLGNRTGFTIHDATGAPIGTIAPLVPEQVDALELGYKGALGDTVYVDAVAYDSWYHDFISPLTQLANPANGTFATYADGTPTAMGTPMQGALSTYVNFGKAQIRGVDVGVDVRPIERLTLSASGSILQLVSFANDNPLEQDLRMNAPAYKARLSAEVTDVAVPHTFVRVDARAHSAYAFESGYWSSQALLGGDVPRRLVVDLSAGWAQPNGGWMVSGTLADLTNDHTPDVLGAPIPGLYGWIAVGYRYAGLDGR
jgi:iron complex outermembrane receptor protein